MSVNAGDHYDRLVLQAKEQAVRESAKIGSANISVDDGIGFRAASDELHHPPNLLKKFAA